MLISFVYQNLLFYAWNGRETNFVFPGNFDVVWGLFQSAGNSEHCYASNFLDIRIVASIASLETVKFAAKILSTHSELCNLILKLGCWLEKSIDAFICYEVKIFIKKPPQTHVSQGTLERDNSYIKAWFSSEAFG